MKRERRYRAICHPELLERPERERERERAINNPAYSIYIRIAERRRKKDERAQLEKKRQL